MARSTVPVPPQARHLGSLPAGAAWYRSPGETGCGNSCRGARRLPMMRVTAQVTRMTTTAEAQVSVKMVRASTAICQILATAGPILAATKTAAMIATAAMPAPWSGGLQQDGLHMTGRLRVGSVRHATHLFLNAWDGFGVAGRARGWPSPRPGTMRESERGLHRPRIDVRV